MQKDKARTECGGVEYACMPRKSKRPAPKNTNDDLSQELEKWDSVIWLGALNYRIQCTNSEVVLKLMQNNKFDALGRND